MSGTDINDQSIRGRRGTWQRYAKLGVDLLANHVFDNRSRDIGIYWHNPEIFPFMLGFS